MSNGQFRHTTFCIYKLKIKMFKNLLLFMMMAVLLTYSLKDKVDCFRLTDSRYGHYVNCSATKPLPLRTQTTFQLDLSYEWTVLSYSVELMDGQTQQKISLMSKCMQGTPPVGNRTAGTNLTLAMTCNSLPRDLKMYDLIHYTIIFPNMEWLTYGIPIPGFSTYEDVKKVMTSSQYDAKKIVNDMLNQQQRDDKALKLVQKINQLKHIRKIE